MSWLETLLRFGIGPSGSVVPGATPAGDVPVGELDGEADAAVTATVSAADGGVHFSVVADAGRGGQLHRGDRGGAGRDRDICALSETGRLSDTELTLQLAVPAPLAQPLVNVGFRLDGWAARATVTSAAEPLLSVETRTT